LRIANAVRDRFDGERRSPFNEAECGHHYARAMSSWALVLAASGFSYDGITGHLSLDNALRSNKQFWSNGNAWGTVERKDGPEGNPQIVLEVATGSIVIHRLTFKGESVTIDTPQPLTGGARIELPLGTGSQP
jgi:hypothetical protein